MIEQINWQKINGLLPAIIQDHQTRQVLMMGYMNQPALAQTLETGLVTFYSRSKQRLWMKGETSNQVLKVVEILPDCDQDTLLIYVNLQGDCCHLNQRSCFSSVNENAHWLQQLEQIIQSRDELRPEGKYTTQLFERGVKRIAQKVGEEGVEVALAAMSQCKQEVMNESADLIYHLFVLLRSQKIAFSEVLKVMQQRSVA